MNGSPDRWLVPMQRFLRMCRRNMRRAKAADSTKVELTGAGLLARTVVLRRLVVRLLSGDERNVGILLPPSVATVVANASLLLDRRVPINLNYTVSSDVLNLCISRAGIRHVVTSRKLMERFANLRPAAELVYLEDLKERVRLADKLAAAAEAWAFPIAALERRYRLNEVAPDDLMTVIFTSGSTGDPKGVMLTQHNVGTNVDAFNAALRLGRDDVLLGILPLFHSFGYTVTMWAVLMLEPKAVYHSNPLDYHQVGALCREHGVTMLVSAPTFLRSYVRRIAPEDFRSVNTVVTGAEKLPRELADAFEQKFGVRPYEGYGTTELSPVVSVNIPPVRSARPGQVEAKEGTVGRPVPGVKVKTIDLETGGELPPGQSGMLLVSGPNVMRGYLNDPEKTAEVIRDGWYVTGDIAEIDADGFIHITGRESRFSKIGGEMVPHIRVEEALQQVLPSDQERISLAVTGVPDARKGERIVVLHTGLPKPPGEICRDLTAAGLPQLWIPSPDSFCQVPEIPLLGTGKLDLRRLRDLAHEKFRADAPDRP